MVWLVVAAGQISLSLHTLELNLEDGVFQQSIRKSLKENLFGKERQLERHRMQVMFVCLMSGGFL